MNFMVHASSTLDTIDLLGGQSDMLSGGLSMIHILYALIASVAIARASE